MVNIIFPLSLWWRQSPDIVGGGNLLIFTTLHLNVDLYAQNIAASPYT